MDVRFMNLPPASISQAPSWLAFPVRTSGVFYSASRWPRSGLSAGLCRFLMEDEMVERSILLIELENHLGEASKALRAAWRLCKHNGMEATAKELADTVLDVETAHQQVSDERAA